MCQSNGKLTRLRNTSRPPEDATFNHALQDQTQGHRELIIYPIDPNGETLVFDSLFFISQHKWGITICLKFKPKHQ